MSVVSVTELFDGRTGRDDYTKHRTYVRMFEVYTDSDTDGPGTAGGTPLLPRLGDPHPEDSVAVVTDVVPSQDSSDPLRWIVTIDYDTQPTLPNALQPDGQTQPPGTIPENPLARPAVWRVTFQQVQEVARSGLLVDNLGNIAFLPTGITNSAGFLFDPPVMIEVQRPIITVTKNIAFEPNLHAADVADAVNSILWRGVPPRCGRVVGVETESAYENGQAFWRLTYNIAVKWDTWDARPLDAGTMERIITGSNPSPPPALLSELRAITDVAGNPVTEPVPLNGNGVKLGAGETEVYRRYVVYRLRDFNTQLLI